MVKANLSRNYISFEGRTLSQDEMGLMKYAFTNVWIDTFAGGKMITGKTSGDMFTFKRSIWFTIQYSYELFGGGTNGCELRFPKETSSNIWYDVITKKFYTASEAVKIK